MSREAIAHAALAIADTEGLDALNMRSLARSLGVGTTLLYRFVSGRDEIVTDVTALLIAEIDTTEVPGEDWEATLRRVMRSVNQVALRHALAYELLALAPEDRGPLYEHMRELERLLAARQVPPARFPTLWTVINAYVTGFTVLETKAIAAARLPESPDAQPDDADTESLRSRLSSAQTPEAFDEGLEIVIAGLRHALDARVCADAPEGESATTGPTSSPNED